MRKVLSLGIILFAAAFTSFAADSSVYNESESVIMSNDDVTENGSQIGTEEIVKDSIVGEWYFSKFVAVYDSEENLQKAGGKKTTDRLSYLMTENYQSILGNYLADLVGMKFTENGTCIALANYGETNYELDFKLKGSTLTIEYQNFNIRFNVKKKGQSLQLTLPYSDFQSAFNLQSVLPSLSTKGLYLGVVMNK